MQLWMHSHNDEDRYEYETVPLSMLSEVLSPFRVLVVEDDETQWPLWESIIKSTYPLAEIEWEATAPGARALLQSAVRTEQPYSVVISDIFLDGPETGVDLWNQYGNAAAKFIFVSSFSMRKFDELMGSLMDLRFGVPLYLQKPLSSTICKEALRIAL